MPRLTKLVWIAVLALAMPPIAEAASRSEREAPGAAGRRLGQALEVPGHGATSGAAVESLLEDAEAAARRLMAEMAVEALDHPLRLSLTKEDSRLLEQADPSERRYRVGLNLAVDADAGLDRLTAAQLASQPTLPFGAVRATADGGYVWTGAVQSPGATALRLHLSDFSLPPGASAWVYDLNGKAHGPYANFGPHGDGHFWTHNVLADVALLQIRQEGRVSDEQLRQTKLHLDAVGHSGPLFPLGVAAAQTKSFCSFNAPCVENAECYSAADFPAIESVQDAIAHYQFVSGAFIYLCSGGLIADTDPATELPYFLTANHCVSKGREARNVETFFQFAAPCGTSNCPSPGLASTLGANVRATGRAGDFTLLELNESPPLGSWFLGWTTAQTANADGTALHRVSHPSGGPQAYSQHAVDVSAPTCTSWPRGQWIYSRDVVGATEGGSSGSPVTDSAGLVVGQLSGGCGYNVSDVCDSASNATVDGALASYFPSVAQYLDPGTGCSPSPEDCSNGTDDDCDGLSDCLDSDCSADANCQGPGCGGNGSDCLSGADCCSGNCRGGRCRGN